MRASTTVWIIVRSLDRSFPQLDVRGNETSTCQRIGAVTGDSDAALIRLDGTNI